MKKLYKYLLPCFFLLVIASCGKRQFSGYILDEKTHLMIDSARITMCRYYAGDFVDSVTVYSDNKGFFTLDYTEDDKVFTIRKPGYEKRRIFFSPDGDTIELTPIPKPDRLEYITIKKNLQQGDTTFIENEMSTPIHNGDTLYKHPIRTRIYIDPNKSSVYYERLGDFSLSQRDSHLDSLAKRKTIPEGLPLEWLPLYQYNDNYYLYAPCQWLINKYKITGKHLIVYGSMEGIFGLSYNRLIQNANRSFSIKGAKGFFFSQFDITIYLIDKKQGLAVFEFKSTEENSTYYRLMVDANKARLFPVIVHECPDMLAYDYDFEQPDFARLLQKYKNINIKK